MAGYRLNTRRLRADHRPVQYAVVGQEGVLALGGLLSKIFRIRGLSPDELISFDHDRELTIYEVEIRGRSIGERRPTVDLMICLNDRSLDYELSLKKSGTLLLDGSRVKRRPKRTDVEIVAVPTFGLVQDIAGGLSEEILDRFDPVLTSLLGSLEAIENEYPEPDVLRRMFENLQIEPTAPFLSAVYRGYDWLQEIRVRCKTAWGGALN